MFTRASRLLVSADLVTKSTCYLPNGTRPDTTPEGPRSTQNHITERDEGTALPERSASAVIVDAFQRTSAAAGRPTSTTSPRTHGYRVLTGGIPPPAESKTVKVLESC